MSNLIRRQDAIDLIEQFYAFESKSEQIALQIAMRDLPSAQPEPKRGKWIYCEDTTADCVDGYRCDQCGFFVPWDYQHKGIDFIQDYNFCPNCGADMRTAEQIVHDAIDNTPMAEDAYPGIKERLHKAVDDMREVTNGN